MKKLIFILFLIFSIRANAQIDSLSYAAGHQTILAMLAGNFPFIETDNDIKELYRGIQENVQRFQVTNDSAYIVNYSIGYVQGVFFSDSWEHIPEENRPPLSCIIAGLRKVSENKLNLPQDTIDARNYIASVTDSINPVLLPPDERCRYFTSFGIFKGFPHGLEKLLVEYNINNCEPDYKSYAQGFADLLEIMEVPRNAYDYGKKIAFAFLQHTMVENLPVEQIPDVKSPDFLSGIRAALQLEPPKLSVDEIDCVMSHYYASVEPAVVSESIVGNDEDGDKIPLVIQPDEPFEVDWSFEAYAPMLYEDCNKDILDAIQSIAVNLQNFGIKVEPYDLTQVMYTIDDDNPTNYTITEQAIFRIANEWYSQKPSFCMFFCGKDGEGRTVFGVSDTSDVFLSKISGAILKPNRLIEFHFGNDLTRKEDALRWAEFTRRNIGRFVICELNDKIVMCPKVNSEILSGRCAISGLYLSNRCINDLFAFPVETEKGEILEIK